MATLTGHLVADTYKALLKLIDNDIVTAGEKQISDGLGGGTNVFIDQNGFLRANKYKVTGGTSSQFLKGDGSLDSNTYLPTGTTTTNIPEGTNLYFTTNRVLNTLLTGFSPVSGTVTSSDSILTAINKIWWNIVNGGGGGGGGYVPYTGALQSVNLGEWGLTTGFVSFDTTPTGTPTTVGTMSWNDSDGTADLKLKGGNVTLQIGQEEVLRVVNKTGATLAESDFRAVRIRSVAEGGAQGQRLAVVLAQGDNDQDSATTIGIVTETIANNQEGFITTSGEVKKIDTTGAKSYGGLETWVDGDILYLSPTHPGYLTKVKPQAPNHTIIIGWVVYAHAVHGKIFVKVDNGYELDELHNVKITDPQTMDVLIYDDALTGPVWINQNIYTSIGATDVGKGFLSIPNSGSIIPTPTKPRIARINLDDTVDAIEVGTQGYLPFYDDTNFYPNSPAWTDGTQIIIGSNTAFASGNKLSVVGNIAVNITSGYYSGANRLLFRNNTTGEFKIGSDTANDFITFYANSVERMRLNASGYLGIGLTSPTQPLHVKGVLAYPKIIIDNNSTSGGGAFSAYQNGTETANFGISGAWLLDSSSDVAIVATRAGKGIQFYTNGSTSEKMGINSDGNVFIGQTPTYVAGATQLIVRGKTGAGYVGVNHYDMSIKGSMNTFNSVFQVGTSTFHSVAVIVEDIERARFNSGGRMLLGTTTDNTVDILQANGSIIATAIKKTGGISSQYLMADGSVSTGPSLAGYVPTSRTLTINGTSYDLSADRSWTIATSSGTVTSVSATVPTGFAITGSPITTSGTLAITFASGYSLPTTIKQSNWDDAYTWVAGFPSQTGNSGKFLTTNGSTLSWGTVTAGVSSFNTRTGAITLLSADVTGALGYTPVPTTRTLSINGTSYDLSADRSWTITPGSGMRNISTFTATAGQTTFTISGGYTVGLVDVYVNGTRLSSSDFTATNGTTVVLGIGAVVNDIIDIVNFTASLTSGITGSGTSGYHAKWIGSSVLANSLIYDNGSSVGIGTSTLTSILTINESTYPIITFNSSNVTRGSIGFNGVQGQFNISSDLANPMVFYTNGSERMRILSGGNVGIGTSSPTNKLHIYGSGTSGGNIRIQTVTGNDAYMILQDQTREYYTGTSGGFYYIYDNNAALNRLVISSAGRVGINTTSPQAFLHVADGNTGTKLMIEDTYGGNGRWGLGAGIGGLNDTHFTLKHESSSTTVLTATPSGNVGIGTTSPSQRLTVIMNDGTNATGIAIRAINDGGGASQPALTFINGSGNNIAQIVGDNGTGYLAFNTGSSNSERMRIQLNGDVLIGKTATNWQANGFQVATSGINVGVTSTLNVECYFAHKINQTGNFHFFLYNYGGVGSISTNGSSTSFNTTSDYRLKEDFQSLNGLQKIKNINVYDFKWKSTGQRMDGVIAHELQKILPYAVEGIKDGKDMQMVDYSKIVPVLIQSIKELNAKIELLESK